MWGLTINDKHTFDDFGLCCLSCTLDPPEPRLYTIDIPGADGVLDATGRTRACDLQKPHADSGI